jgi:hypothetical protein
MNALYHFQITLKLQGPVLTKASSPASFGLDAAVARDFKTGLPMLPGTLIEGKVRESLDQLGERRRLEELFGRETDRGAANEPARGRLLIGDFIAEKNGSEGGSLSRVALDSTLGSAKGEMLRVIETPFLAGEAVEFKGHAEMFCVDDTAANEIVRLLQLGLGWLVQVGAQRTTGFGKVLDVAVSKTTIGLAPTSITTAPVALDLAISPLGPLCVARHKIGDNLFESDDIIPGNMLAGSVMETAKAMGLDHELKRRGFDHIRFQHAFPTTSARRPRALPLSTVKAGNIPYDIADNRSPILLRNGEKSVAPEFPIDWKERCDVLGQLDWAHPARELRVRTAIDSTSRTAERGDPDGEGGKLFAWEMIHPFADGETKPPIVWRTRIDLAGVTDRLAVAQDLAKVLAQLSFVGKTKMRCAVAVVPITTADSAPEINNGDTLRLVLQTPALLADPRFQELDGVPRSGAISAADMLKLYQSAWSELSGNGLKLIHHFARQFLAGGNYLAHRFQKNKPYNPWLLTDAGSVFVFKVINSENAKTKLATWLSAGMPLPAWAKQTFGDKWNENPYRPENGFGEIAVHVPEFATPATDSFTLADPILP